MAMTVRVLLSSGTLRRLYVLFSAPLAVSMLMHGSARRAYGRITGLKTPWLERRTVWLSSKETSLLTGSTFHNVCAVRAILDVDGAPSDL